MNDLRRELAPIPGEAWQAIDEEARRVLQDCLAARRLVATRGPLGWQHSAEGRGRVRLLADPPADGVVARLREVQPLVELRVPFELAREELDAVARGARDPELRALDSAACNLALAEDRAVFQGYVPGAVAGMSAGSPHQGVTLGEDAAGYPRAVARALYLLREAGVAGPYALALDPRAHERLAAAEAPGGFPLLQHVQQLVDRPVVWAPGLEGGMLVSLRGGDFELVLGRDASIGYLEHDRATVRLYLEESFTFRVFTAEAAVPMRH